MKVEINLNNDSLLEELRELVKKEVKSVARKEITDIFKDVVRDKVKALDDKLDFERKVDDVTKNTIRNFVRDELKGGHFSDVVSTLVRGEVMNRIDKIFNNLNEVR